MGTDCLAMTGTGWTGVAALVAFAAIAVGALVVARTRTSDRRTASVAGPLLAVLLVGAVGGALVPSSGAVAADRGAACVTAPAPAAAPEPAPQPAIAAAGVLSGVAWIDADGDALRGDEEFPAEGVQVTLLNAATGLPVTEGANGPLVSTVSTDAAGGYRFADLIPGDYLIEIGSAATVVGETLTGAVPVGFSPFTIEVADASGFQTFTVSGGSFCPGDFSYSFAGSAHAYSVTSAVPLTTNPEIQPAVLVAEPVTVDAGSDDLDSDVDPATRRTLAATSIGAGQTVEQVDVGLLSVGTERSPVTVCD